MLGQLSKPRRAIARALVFHRPPVQYRRAMRRPPWMQAPRMKRPPWMKAPRRKTDTRPPWMGPPRTPRETPFRFRITQGPREGPPPPPGYGAAAGGGLRWVWVILVGAFLLLRRK